MSVTLTYPDVNIDEVPSGVPFGESHVVKRVSRGGEGNMEATRAMHVRMEEAVRQIQDTFCQAVEQLDGKRFCEDVWSRPGGGGGTSRVLQDGNVFEKAGVNVSAVHGTLSPEAAWNIGGGTDLRDESHNFFATGISLVIHPHNPMVPSVHANYRYFKVGDGPQPRTWWFGGGADLSPSYLFDADVVHFHRWLKHVCDQHDLSFYPRFKKWCDEYFYLPHREEHRGVGGIFFDQLNDRDAEALFDFVISCAQALLPAYLPIVEKRCDMPFTDAQRKWQQLRRGRYVEFNLLRDRGTAFGLKTNGRTESILISLPLVVRWEYEHHPVPGSEEARLIEVLQQPREWV